MSEKCEMCKNELQNDCQLCGAPVCCFECCERDYQEAIKQLDKKKENQ